MLHLLLKALTLLHTIPNHTFLGQKFNLDKSLLLDIFEFLRQNWIEYFIIKKCQITEMLFVQRLDFWNGVNCASCFFDVLHQKKFSPSGCLQTWVSEKNGPHQSFREAHVLTNSKGFCYPRTNDFRPLARTSNKTETCLIELRHHFDKVSNFLTKSSHVSGPQIDPTSMFSAPESWTSKAIKEMILTILTTLFSPSYTFIQLCFSHPDLLAKLAKWDQFQGSARKQTFHKIVKIS